MPFAAGLKQSLYAREDEVASEFLRGDSLEDVLNRHLLTVERMSETELLTSVLLLSSDRRRLSHGAAPNLPRSYCEAVDGSEIGASAGSCGTAAYFGRPVYVADIETDPLWAEYRHLALPHGLRSCWSTPILDPDGAVIGTFAIYHRTASSPTKEELEAIDMITGHVAQAIISAQQTKRLRPRLTLVSDNHILDGPSGEVQSLMMKVATLERVAAQLERDAGHTDFEDYRSSLETLAKDSRELAAVIRRILTR